jgi:hypothetical protein
MATRSTIAIEAADGTVKQVYCHWDGYLDHNGKILLENYDQAKTAALVALGSVSSLRKEVGEKHDFDENFDRTDPRYQWTRFYARDRGEDLDVHEFANFEAYRKDHQYEEYEYILRSTGEWHVASYGDEYVPLVDAIAAEMIEKELAEDE